MSEFDTRIKVILRIRPPNNPEKAWFQAGTFGRIVRDGMNTENADSRVIIDYSGKSYDYDKVFREDCVQKSIFKEAAIPTLENVFKGYCGAVLAYGQTGTGKTHTMQGYDKTSAGDERGIIPRCADYIFTRVQRESNIYKFKITVMFVQIYLDKLQDLFKPEAPEVNINPETERVELPGITEEEITSTDQFMKLFYFGEKHRVTRPTLMNPTSSRGHAALIVNVRMEPIADLEATTKVGKLVLVDLAGYERFAQTGITTGIAAEEAKKINASLLALGSVVNALAEKQSHVPYRNAKLTRLLKDCLGGNSKSTIVLAVGPCDKYKQETAGTLYFGWRAMAVKVSAKIKEEYDPTKYIMNLKDKLTGSNDLIKNLVKFLKAIGQYEKYTEKFGEPSFVGDLEDDEETEEIMAALTRQPSRRMSRAATQAQLKAIQMGVAPPQNLVAMPNDLVLADDGDTDPDAPEAVRTVQKQWNADMRAHQEAANRELEMLRMRHIQDLDEARSAGVTEEVLARLREEHEEEIKLMQEQNSLLREDLSRQKGREEAQALLSSAMTSQAKMEGSEGPVFHSDDARINEMVSHLQATCGNKDEVLVRLFELICLRESEIKDYEVNSQAIAVAQMEEANQTTLLRLQESQKEMNKLRAELSNKNQEIERLRRTTGQSSAAVHTSNFNASSLVANNSGSSSVPRTIQSQAPANFGTPASFVAPRGVIQQPMHQQPIQQQQLQQPLHQQQSLQQQPLQRQMPTQQQQLSPQLRQQQQTSSVMARGPVMPQQQQQQPQFAPQQQQRPAVYGQGQQTQQMQQQMPGQQMFRR